ncbi:RbsD/FucU family protein [Companilactobacillus baiquanensis]|uniref:RbsD/FucU family protein n=1 Tax=Companilactobacillus baiquanensis TaxID=2486005 RepID=A0ABW1UW11_9LACO|nr:RbsD/FucU domain-containing protein [Companilactobacillus baiquanensis]
MLKGIPSILPPELMKLLMEMGHGDELLIGDGNYPKFGQPAENVIRMDGHGIPEILDAVMQLIPLDPYVDNPTMLMAVLPDDPYVPTIWDDYRKIVNKYEAKGTREIQLEKPEFYERGTHAYAAIATSETALYANIILRKGVVVPK